MCSVPGAWCSGAGVSYVWVVAGAVVGAPLRYFIGSRFSVEGGEFPWGTFAVNATGCLAIGLILGFAESRGSLSREARLLLVTGFLGSYTTFSAFGWETYALLRADEFARALTYAAGSVILGLAAVWLGASVGKTGA